MTWILTSRIDAYRLDLIFLICSVFLIEFPSFFPSFFLCFFGPFLEWWWFNVVPFYYYVAIFKTVYSIAMLSIRAWNDPRHTVSIYQLSLSTYMCFISSYLFFFSSFNKDIVTSQTKYHGTIVFSDDAKVLHPI